MIANNKYLYNVDLELDTEFLDTLNDEQIESCFAKTGNLKLIKSFDIPTYSNRCTNYAFNNKDLYYCEDAFDLLMTNYIPILLSQTQSGDIISFHDCFGFPIKEKFAHEDNVQHFAIVTKPGKRLKDIRIKSKWGQAGIFESDLKTLPESYGDIIIFWRKKRRENKK
ncbi:MAG: hypothetical protein ACTSPD_09890 [Promethearchaeota archaeon]